jgi:hypothetical protein
MHIAIIIVLVQILTTSLSASCDPGCTNCNSGTCSACSPSYLFESGHCYKCADSNCNNCTYPGTQCLGCVTGYAPRSNDTICLPCSNFTDSNCDSIFHFCPNCASCNSYAINAINQCSACN